MGITDHTGKDMHTHHPNYTIVVNWMKKGFGCAKVCAYCNWRESPLLPHGGQSADAITAFIRQCRKPFITISGGADPFIAGAAGVAAGLELRGSRSITPNATFLPSAKKFVMGITFFVHFDG
jgi:hypothetical protein